MASIDPIDYTDIFNTQLTPEQETAYTAWAKANNRERDTYDYDLRGAWKADAQAAANGHLPDTWKKPNHPTFSKESMYNGVEGMVGGMWQDMGNDQWQYVASPTNVGMHGVEALKKYFSRVEPNNKLVLP
jgi:hypothetical protein